MKKTFQLIVANKNKDRQVESIKNDVRKYIKRERTKKLPENTNYWNFDCKSHYWIKNNNIKQAPKWDNKETQKERGKGKKKKFRKLKIWTFFKF